MILFLLVALLTLSIGLHFVCLLVYGGNVSNFLRMHCIYENRQHWRDEDPDADFIGSVVKRAMDDRGDAISYADCNGLLPDMYSWYSRAKNRLFRRESHIYNDWPHGYTLVGLSYFAMRTQDSGLIAYLTKMADKDILGSGALKFRIEYIVQIPMGLFYLNLWRITGIERYLSVATDVLRSLESFCDANMIVSYFWGGNAGYYFVDGLGMIVPFLMEYYNATKDEKAKEIALTNMRYYSDHLVDIQTGLPCHGFDPFLNVKMGSMNWGRGIGWYLFAVAYCRAHDSKLLYNTIEKMPYTQFPGVPGSPFDSSVAIMFEIYKQANDQNRMPDLKCIKHATSLNGRILKCSGDTQGFNRYARTFCESRFCNGMLLTLISRFSTILPAHG